MVPFRTYFWLDDKRWFVTCAYVPKACAIWLHTASIRDSGIERLMRCEVSWIDKQCRLTQRSIDEMVDNTDDMTLTTLSLNENQIEDEGAKRLADALRHNTTLTILNLKDNQIGHQGAKRLAEALRANTGVGWCGSDNLYVVDEYNRRIQRFNLLTNSCADQQLISSESTASISSELIIVTSTKQTTAISTESTIEFSTKQTRTCVEISTTAFNCTCAPGWKDNQCERKIDYCYNITCENKGICRSMLTNYTCECLGESYSDRHCDIITKKILICRIISKSFAYIAIIPMTIVAMFVVIMDILKYCFGIDPT
ncbi:unnamed protein product [Rotaria sordida]|uniref:EGF-like domain-containing protein n=1 Tax=Rotaria sordida TaxID=392033 RepID=A0A818YPC4_9BILA|nr:unnamed protein product [Rotaria sordida]